MERRYTLAAFGDKTRANPSGSSTTTRQSSPSEIGIEIWSFAALTALMTEWVSVGTTVSLGASVPIRCFVQFSVVKMERTVFASTDRLFSTGKTGAFPIRLEKNRSGIPCTADRRIQQRRYVVAMHCTYHWHIWHGRYLNIFINSSK